jgi:ribokinase
MRSGGFIDFCGGQAPALDSKDRTGMGKRRLPGDLKGGAFKTGRGAGFVFFGIIVCHYCIVNLILFIVKHIYIGVVMKILVFGSLNIDLIFSVDHIVLPGETISSSALVKSAGGKGANQAAALGKAGAPVYMGGKIGQDGQFLPALLQSYGVDTSRVMVYEGATGQALIQLDKHKQNSIVLFAGGNGAVSVDEIDTVLEGFGSGDLVVLQNEISCLREIMERAHKRGIQICLNPSPYNETIEKLPLDLVNMFFVNELEGAFLAALPQNTPLLEVLEGLVRRFPKSEILLTAGKDGAWYGCGAVREKGDIIDMPVADTTAAGDTFTGYFIAARNRNHSVKESLALACKASSITVSRPGAMQSIPFAKEVFE